MTSHECYDPAEDTTVSEAWESMLIGLVEVKHPALLLTTQFVSDYPFRLTLSYDESKSVRYI